MKSLAMFVFAVLLSGCATNKVMMATGGSRSDGTVTMSYQYGGFEKPVVNVVAAQQEAAVRCQAWGYSSAEAFGGGTSQCIQASGYGCNRWQVSYQYQCLGDLDK